MTRLRGHFDGTSVVLDDPVPEGLRADTPVEVVIPDDRARALREFEAESRAFWSRPLVDGMPSPGRTWRREELHERGRHDLP